MGGRGQLINFLSLKGGISERGEGLEEDLRYNDQQKTYNLHVTVQIINSGKKFSTTARTSLLRFALSCKNQIQ